MGTYEDHDDTFRLLRESIRRYVEKEIVPQGGAWEEEGFVPRGVLQEMGRLGFLGIPGSSLSSAWRDTRLHALLIVEEPGLLYSR